MEETQRVLAFILNVATQQPMHHQRMHQHHHGESLFAATEAEEQLRFCILTGAFSRDSAKQHNCSVHPKHARVCMWHIVNRNYSTRHLRINWTETHVVRSEAGFDAALSTKDSAVTSTYVTGHCMKTFHVWYSNARRSFYWQTPLLAGALKHS